MAIATKRPMPPLHSTRRLWKAPLSRANWLWLGISILIYAGVYIWYLYGLKIQQYPGPSENPFRWFGVISTALVIPVTAYTLRRRFIRTLPGKVQHWLWLHIWFGIIAVLIAFLHVNYDNILHNFYFGPYTFTEAAAGTSALYGMLFLVFSGVIGRLLDLWFARVIAKEASSNGAGIVEAVMQRIHELDLTIERLRAGKSAQFKQYCSQALRGRKIDASLAYSLAPQEQLDFQRASEVSGQRATLTRSLHRQKFARHVIQGWRYIHIPLACISLGVITFHSVVELAKMVLQLFGKG